MQEKGKEVLLAFSFSRFDVGEEGSLRGCSLLGGGRTEEQPLTPRVIKRFSNIRGEIVWSGKRLKIPPRDTDTHRFHISYVIFVCTLFFNMYFHISNLGLLCLGLGTDYGTFYSCIGLYISMLES